MADGEKATTSCSEINEDSQVVDERLDFFSPNFDPLLALNTPGLKPPRPDARVFDNLAAYDSYYNKKHSLVREKDETKSSDVKKAEPVIRKEAPARKWLPHQLPVIKEPKTKLNRNILTRMETIEGPLAALRKCRDQKLRAKITTRNDRGIRGFCLAYIVAFDKHWNLVLEDVEETWDRWKQKRVPAFEGTPARLPGSKNKVKLPQIEIISEEKSSEKCFRRVTQMLLRGDNVVTVQIVKNENA